MDLRWKPRLLRGKEGTDIRIRSFLHVDPTKSKSENGSLAGLGHVLVDRQVLPVHLEAGDTGRGHTIGIGVVQRNGRQVVEQHFLCLLVQLVGVCDGLGGSGLVAQRIELRVLVVAIVGAVAISSSGGVQLPQAPFTLRSDTAVRKSLKVGYGLVAATPAPSTLLMELTTAV